MVNREFEMCPCTDCLRCCCHKVHELQDFKYRCVNREDGLVCRCKPLECYEDALEIVEDYYNGELKEHYPIINEAINEIVEKVKTLEK